VVMASGGIGGLGELLPNPLADAAQAPMFCLLEKHKQVLKARLVLRPGVSGRLEGRLMWKGAGAGSNKVNATG
jgi:hypothetical protein